MKFIYEVFFVFLLNIFPEIKCDSDVSYIPDIQSNRHIWREAKKRSGLHSLLRKRQKYLADIIAQQKQSEEIADELYDKPFHINETDIQKIVNDTNTPSKTVVSKLLLGDALQKDKEFTFTTAAETTTRTTAAETTTRTTVAETTTRTTAAERTTGTTKRTTAAETTTGTTKRTTAAETTTRTTAAEITTTTTPAETTTGTTERITIGTTERTTTITTTEATTKTSTAKLSNTTDPYPIRDNIREIKTTLATATKEEISLKRKIGDKPQSIGDFDYDSKFHKIDTQTEIIYTNKKGNEQNAADIIKSEASTITLNATIDLKELIKNETIDSVSESEEDYEPIFRNMKPTERKKRPRNMYQVRLVPELRRRMQEELDEYTDSLESDEYDAPLWVIPKSSSQKPYSNKNRPSHPNHSPTTYHNQQPVNFNYPQVNPISNQYRHMNLNSHPQPHMNPNYNPQPKMDANYNPMYPPTQQAAHPHQNPQQLTYPNQNPQRLVHSNQNQQLTTYPNQNPQQPTHPNQNTQQPTQPNQNTQQPTQPKQNTQRPTYPNQNLQPLTHLNQNPQRPTHQNLQQPTYPNQNPQQTQMYTNQYPVNQNPLRPEQVIIHQYWNPNSPDIPENPRTNNANNIRFSYCMFVENPANKSNPFCIPIHQKIHTQNVTNPAEIKNSTKGKDLNINIHIHPPLHSDRNKKRAFYSGSNISDIISSTEPNWGNIEDVNKYFYSQLKPKETEIESISYATHKFPPDGFNYEGYIKSHKEPDPKTLSDKLKQFLTYLTTKSNALNITNPEINTKLQKNMNDIFTILNNIECNQTSDEQNHTKIQNENLKLIGNYFQQVPMLINSSINILSKITEKVTQIENNTNMIHIHTSTIKPIQNLEHDAASNEQRNSKHLPNFPYFNPMNPFNRLYPYNNIPYTSQSSEQYYSNYMPPIQNIRYQPNYNLRQNRNFNFRNPSPVFPNPMMQQNKPFFNQQIPRPNVIPQKFNRFGMNLPPRSPAHLNYPPIYRPTTKLLPQKPKPHEESPAGPNFFNDDLVQNVYKESSPPNLFEPIEDSDRSRREVEAEINHIRQFLKLHENQEITPEMFELLNNNPYVELVPCNKTKDDGYVKRETKNDDVFKENNMNKNEYKSQEVKPVDDENDDEGSTENIS